MVNLNESYPHIVDFGIDWLRLTWRKDSDELPAVGETIYQRLVELHEQGDLTTEKKLLNFKGIGSDRLSWTSNETHVMVQATSGEANETGKRLIRAGVRGQCTRIDTQVTAQYGERGAQRAQKVLQSVNGASVSDKTRNIEKSALFANSYGDTGVTLGARASSIYARFYHAQTGGHTEYDAGVWRYEIEWKRNRAKQIWDAARISPNPDVLAASYTTGQFLALGIDEPFFRHVLPEKPEQLPYTRSSDKTLMWLENQVKPAIHNLIEAGRGEDVDRFLKDLENSFGELRGVNGRLASRELISQIERKKT